MVPSALTTQLGGFYINQGQLNFREISGDEDDDDDDFIHVAKSRKKRTPHKVSRLRDCPLKFAGEHLIALLECSRRALGEQSEKLPWNN